MLMPCARLPYYERSVIGSAQIKDSWVVLLLKLWYMTSERQRVLTSIAYE